MADNEKKEKRVQDELPITDFRRELHEDLKKNGIRPVTVRDKFCGVLITVGKKEDWEKDALLSQLKFNPLDAVTKMIDD